MNETDSRFSRIQQSALKFNCQFNSVDITNVNQIQDWIDSLGDIVLRKSSKFVSRLLRLHCYDIRTFTRKLLLDSGKFLLNRWAFTNLDLDSKYYQYLILKHYSSLNLIPTHYFFDKNELMDWINTNEISFPIIMKPLVGARWNWIHLLKWVSDLSKIDDILITKYLFQPYIQNDWDFRVIVLWWRVLWIIKRIKTWDSVLNNISKWWLAQKISDSNQESIISEIALKTVSLFDLDFAWVDVIFDKITNKYYYMEVNPLSQREWFERVYTDINVSDELIKYCLSKIK